MKKGFLLLMFLLPPALYAEILLEPQMGLGVLGQESTLSLLVDTSFHEFWKIRTAAEVVQGNESDAWLYSAGVSARLWRTSKTEALLSLGAGAAVLQNSSAFSSQSESFFLKQELDFRYLFTSDFFSGIRLGWMFVRPDKKVYAFPSAQIVMGVAL